MLTKQNPHPKGTDANNPYHIFPEEIWEIILEKCEDAIGISSVLKTFPQLKILSLRKQSFWFLGEIFSLIFPKLIRFKDMKNCRLVCKRWKSAVDKSLATNASLLPFGSPSYDGIPETHFNYHNFDISTSIFNFMWFGHEVDYEIETEWSLENPFPSRRVNIDLEILYNDFEYYQKFSWHSPKWVSAKPPLTPKISGSIKEQMLSTLEMVGHHIWYATFFLPSSRHWDEEQWVINFMQYLVKCLSYLPNLMFLKLGKRHGDYKGTKAEFKSVICATLRESSILAHLETLDLWTEKRIDVECVPRDLYTSFCTLFIKHCYIKKLVIYVGHWDDKIPNLFPHLNDLCLKEDTLSTEKSLLKNVLKRLVGFRYLRKLTVWGRLKPAKIINAISAEYVEALELQLHGLHKRINIFKSVTSKVSKMFHATPANMLSNIRSLKMEIYSDFFETCNQFNFKFLSLLPNLQNLTILVAYFDRYDDIVSECLSRILHKNRDNLNCLTNLWDAYPNLNTLRVETSNKFGLYQCIREEPEKVFTFVEDGRDKF